MTHRRLLLVVLFMAIFTFDLARPTDMDFWWHIRTVLTGKDSALSVLLTAAGGWERRFQGQIEEVFVRRAGADDVSGK